jgi:hypothetical protein
MPFIPFHIDMGSKDVPADRRFMPLGWHLKRKPFNITFSVVHYGDLSFLFEPGEIENYI